MSITLNTIRTSKIVAIIRLDNYDAAVEVARALVAGGITALEFTLTGSGATAAVSATRAALGDAVQVGIGSVLHPAQVEESVAAGAQFVVTPALRPAVINACQKHSIPILSGGVTPTELLTAYELGADMLKLFPARLGGPAYLRDILAPLPMLPIVPTGGVSAENARAYLDAGAVALGVGGNLVSAKAVKNANWAEITAAAQAVVAAVQA